MNVTTMSGSTCACPTCDAFTMKMANGGGEYCPSCGTVVSRFRTVKVIQPNALANVR